ncbi:MAG: hypothetical protein E7256_10990 [Lachnospiraceae bacterium]|nr:hypothetical protein [Lachnospiraceae bacterium]
MEWNEGILKYAKEHKECTVYGVAFPDEDGREGLNLIVPNEYGTILMQQEVHDYGRGISKQACAMMKIVLNQSYTLSVKNQNLVKKGWDMITKSYVHIQNEDFNRKFAVTTNHPEFTKLALSELEWMQYMLEHKNLTVFVSPVEEKGLDHTIKVYYNTKLFDDFFGTGEENKDMVEQMIEAAKRTHYMLSRYKIEDNEVVAD